MSNGEVIVREILNKEYRRGFHNVSTTNNAVFHVLLVQYVIATLYPTMVIGVSSQMVYWNSSSVRMGFVVHN